MKHRLFIFSKAGVVFSFLALFLCSCDGLLPRKIDTDQEEEIQDDNVRNAIEVTPEDYITEIEDFVKYRIAMLNYLVYTDKEIADYYDYYSDDELEERLERVNDYIDKIDDEIIDLWTNGDDDFRTILAKTSSNQDSYYADWAEELLREYNSTSINLSGFKEFSSSNDEKNWVFEEKNSGLSFIFTWYKKAGRWEVKGSEAVFEKYVSEKFDEQEEW